MWQERSQREEDAGLAQRPRETIGVLQIALVTFANGGDNIGVYVPVLAVAGISGMATYIVVFLIGVAIWCVLGWHLASRPAVARGLRRWGHILLPAVLIAIGLVILSKAARSAGD